MNLFTCILTMGSRGGYVVCDCEYDEAELPKMEVEWKLALDGASPLLLHASVLCGLWLPEVASEITNTRPFRKNCITK